MPRLKPPFELVLPPREPGAPAGRWLYAALRSGILEGRLPPGGRLPATRELAKHYGLSRGTVVAAFDQLRSEGYIAAAAGSGTRVAPVLPDRLLEAGRPAMARGPTSPSDATRLSEYARRVREFPYLRPAPVRAFRTDQPALDLFPTTLWAQVAGRRLRRASVELLLACPPLGYPPLREAVADYLSAARGVTCTAEQVVIVSGVQEGLDLMARLLLDPGDRAALEEPGYTGARLTLEASGAGLVPVGLDGEGVVLDPAALDGVRLAYLTPAHQFPLGVCMSLPRRLIWLEWARRSGAMLFEDDYDSEFRYSGPPMPALQGLDRHGRVVFAGSFSKVLFPSLRLGYLVVPDHLLDRVAATLSVTIRHAPLPAQAILADFIGGGHFGRHVRRMRQVYAERLSVLVEAAAARLAGLVELSRVEAGLQTAAWLPDGTDGGEVAAALARREVEATPLSRYARRPLARDGLQLGFAAVDAPEIRRGVGELAAVLDAEARRSG